MIAAAGLTLAESRAMSGCAVSDCSKTVVTRGWCRMHYTRWQRHGDPAIVRKPFDQVPLIDRFMAKIRVDDATGCWIWTGGKIGGRSEAVKYGGFKVNRRTVLAHRWSYEHFVGPIPAGLELDHVYARGCRHTLCVNPDHLEPVTHQENILRSSGKSATAARTGVCSEGHDLTGDNVYVTPSTGFRRCRKCRQAKEAAQRQQVAS